MRTLEKSAKNSRLMVLETASGSDLRATSGIWTLWWSVSPQTSPDVSLSTLTTGLLSARLTIKYCGCLKWMSLALIQCQMYLSL